MKKITALLTTFLISFSMLAPMASATAPVPDDYTPGTRPSGLTSNNQYDTFSRRSAMNSYLDFSRDEVPGAVTIAWKDNTTFGWKPEGVYTPIQEWNQADKSTLVGKSYVFHAKAKMVSGGSKTLGVGIGTYNMGVAGSYHTQTVGTDWTDIKATLTMPSTADALGNRDNLLFGFVQADAPAAGDKFAILSGKGVSSKANDIDSENYYLAEEVAYDISAELTSGSSVIPQGAAATLTAKAAIVNQIGQEGNVNLGGFDWYALNADKTATATGITVTANEDTKTATIVVADDVAPGKYNIVAVSTAENTTTNWAKTIPLTVQNVTSYEPAETLPTSYTSAHRSDSQTLTFISNGVGSANANEVHVSWAASGNSTWKPSGAYAKITELQSQSNDAVRNKRYVVQVRLKADQERTLGVGIGTYTATVPDSYATWTVGTEYNDYKAVLRMPTASEQPSSLNRDNLQIGFMTAPEVGAEFWASNQAEDFYMAEEKLWDIGHSVKSGKTNMEIGETLVVSAELFNQIGLPYSLGNGSFSWLVLDENDAIAEDVSLTVNGNQASFSADVAGTYKLVAVSATNSELVEVIPVTVATPTGVTAFELAQTEGTVGLNATVLGDDKVYFVLAAYDGTKLTKCTLVPVSPSNGTAAVTAADCKLENLTDGTKVKAFAWTESLSPIVEKGDFTKELTISLQS